MIYFPIYSKSTFELFMSIFFFWWASLIAQLVKNPSAMQKTLVQYLDQEDLLERDRLPTPVFLGFPCGSAGKESTCTVGDLGSIPVLERSSGEGKRLPNPIFWPGEFHGLYSPWGHKESNMTEWLSLSFADKCFVYFLLNLCLWNFSLCCDKWASQVTQW